MNLLYVFGIGANRILGKNCCVNGIVTSVSLSFLHVIKKPVRLYNGPHNTIYSHYITFTYTVDSIPYRGKLFVDLRFRCPQKGETIEVYYDPENPSHYAFYSFGPRNTQIGW